MSDKELLELAANAAGIDLTMAWMYGPKWNPLIDDGDALRLAVKLHMFDAGNFMALRLEETRLNPARTDCEITRRAIVRAAAEIGRGL